MIARDDALSSLDSSSSNDRLRAARALREVAEAKDLPRIKNALLKEDNRWVKSALRYIIAEVTGDGASIDKSPVDDAEDDALFEQMRSEVVLETTQLLLHEIKPIVGRLDFNASLEIPSYLGSETEKECSRLKRFLQGVEELRGAASPSSMEDLDFADVINQIVATFGAEAGRFSLAGVTPFVVRAARNLLEFVIFNGARNALEASVGSTANVVLNWGKTDVDYWFTILDDGIGLPTSTSNMFKIGITNKRGHLGMGLAIGQQAASSLGGKIFLRPRSQGTAFELRWPLSV